MRNEQDQDAMVVTRFSTVPFDRQKILILDYLASGLPFANYGLRSVLDSIHIQLTTLSYAIGLKDDALCGYIGWVLSDKQAVEAWHAGQAPLRAAGPESDAAAITILAVSDPSYSLPLVRFTFRQLAGKSVYWKRHVPDRGLISRQIDRA